MGAHFLFLVMSNYSSWLQFVSLWRLIWAVARTVKWICSLGLYGISTLWGGLLKIFHDLMRGSNSLSEVGLLRLLGWKALWLSVLGSQLSPRPCLAGIGSDTSIDDNVGDNSNNIVLCELVGWIYVGDTEHGTNIRVLKYGKVNWFTCLGSFWARSSKSGRLGWMSVHGETAHYRINEWHRLGHWATMIISC